MSNTSKPAPLAGSNVSAFGFWAIAILTVFVSHSPGFSWIFAPVNIFTTAIHELGHASVCLLTGGHVSGLTIVSDGAGHGGLTFCLGGNPFLYTQSGYLGAAFFGCLLIYLGQFPKFAKSLLTMMGLVMGFAALFLVSGSLLVPGHFLQGVGSLLWTGLMSVALTFAGVKLKPGLAHLVVLFLAVQTALNSLTAFGDLLSASLGVDGYTGFSDASNMAMITGIPAVIWSVFWAGTSILMVGFTLWSIYGKHIFASGKAK
jgi:hypothetical protein